MNALSAAAFFKSLKEESTLEEVIGTFGKAYQWELPANKSKSSTELDELEKIIKEQSGAKWEEVTRLCGDDAARRKALILLYTHLLRISINSTSLQRGQNIIRPFSFSFYRYSSSNAEQTQILLQTPLLLSALLNISISRSWLIPTIAVMRLHAYLAQALLPVSERSRFAQLPGIKTDELATLAPQAENMADFAHALEEKQDGRVVDVKKAMEKWGRADIVDASFKGSFTHIYEANYSSSPL